MVVGEALCLVQYAAEIDALPNETALLTVDE